MAPGKVGSPACGLAIAALLGTLATPGVARAYEDQWSLFAGAGYSFTSGAELPQHGVALGIGAGLGLGDTWELRVEASYAIHPGDTPLHRIGGAAEIVYVVDILTVVPFFGVGLGGAVTILDAATADGGGVRGDFVAQGVVGLDWLVSREFVLGVEVRPRVLLTSLPTDALWLTATLRAQVLFEL